MNDVLTPIGKSGRKWVARNPLASRPYPISAAPFPGANPPSPPDVMDFKRSLPSNPNRDEWPHVWEGTTFGELP